MAEEEVGVRLTLKEQARFRAGMKGASREVENFSGAAKRAGRTMRGEFGKSVTGALRAVKYGAVGAGAAVTGFVAASTVSGLKLNAQMQELNSAFSTLLGSESKGQAFVETMRGLTDVGPIRLTSALDAARGLINAGMGPGGVRDVLAGVQNAALVAGGNPEEKMAQIAEILTVIQARGKISAEELNRFGHAGIDVRKILQKELNLTGEEVANIGAQGVTANKAIKALTRAFTTGNMAKAAKNAEGNFNVQVAQLTKNFEMIKRLATEDLFTDINRKVMPSLLKTSKRVGKIFNSKDLDLGEKFEESFKAAKVELGPLWQQLERELKDADLGGKLADAVEWGVPKMADAAAKAAPKAVGAFINAWLNAGMWGKLLTSAFLLKKIGAFKAAGGMANDMFLGGFRKKGGFRKIGRVAGGAFALAFAAEAAASTDPNAPAADRWAQFVDNLMMEIPGSLVTAITGEKPTWRQAKPKKIGEGRYVHTPESSRQIGPGMARGGLVGGTGRGDTQIRRLDPREFVMNPQAVRDIGVGNLAAMNQGRTRTPTVIVKPGQVVLNIDGRTVADAVFDMSARITERSR